MPGNSSQTRGLLLAGFGGLLALLAFACLNGLSSVRQIQSRNEQIRSGYFARNRILQQLRSDLYLSGTYVRDLLLEPNPDRAAIHRKEFENVEAQIRFNCSAYARILLSGEGQPFQEFITERDRYFRSLSPALHWSAAQRQALGYSFMVDSLLPQRTSIVRLADQLSDLNESQLQTGNKQVSDLFQSFQQSLILVTILLLACGGVLAGVSIRQVLRLETAARLQYEEVLQARSALRDLSGRLVAVQEAERRAISRELHDEVGQAVSGLLLGIGNVAAALPDDTGHSLRTQLQDLRHLAEQTVAVVRTLSLLLRPSMLDDLGLLPALQWQAREVSRTREISVQVQSSVIDEDRLSEEQKTCIYRVVQEALNNVTRHARARSARVQLQQMAGRLLLTVQDDGQGFVPGSDKGLGLLGMEERVKHLLGEFRIESQPGAGTAIHVELPVPEEARQC